MPPQPIRLAVLSTLALVAGVVAVEVALSWNNVHPRVSVEGIPLGGRSLEGARRHLDTTLAPIGERSATIRYCEQRWSFSGRDLGLQFDTRAIAQTAMAFGREGSIPAQIAARAKAWIFGIDLHADSEALLSKLDTATTPIAQVTDLIPTPASTSLRGLTPWITTARQGRALDRFELHHQLITELLHPAGPFEAAVIPLAPAVSDDEARLAAESITRWLGPMTVIYAGESFAFTPHEVSSWIRLDRIDDVYGPTLDLVETRADLMERIGPSIKPLAVDARFKIVNDAVTIIPAQAGLGPDMPKFAAALTRIVTTPGAERKILLETAYALPALTTEEAEALHITQKLSTYRTTFPFVSGRVNNIHLLAGSLDGKLVAPGEVFSFNGAVGKRTADKGYREAPAIIRGKLKPSIGGGICQVGTTIFNAIFEAGLPFVERSNHSLYISHYPMGRDATVSWGGPDIKFLNDTPNWILIATAYTNNSITVQLWGTDPGIEVKAETSDWYGIRGFETVETHDPSLPLGTVVVDERGQSGRSCKVVRTVMKNGAVVRKDTFFSNYQAKKHEVRVGTGPVAAPATAQGHQPPTPGQM